MCGDSDAGTDEVPNCGADADADGVPNGNSVVVSNGHADGSSYQSPDSIAHLSPNDIPNGKPNGSTDGVSHGISDSSSDRFADIITDGGMCPGFLRLFRFCVDRTVFLVGRRHRLQAVPSWQIFQYVQLSRLRTM